MATVWQRSGGRRGRDTRRPRRRRRPPGVGSRRGRRRRHRRWWWTSGAPSSGRPSTHPAAAAASPWGTAHLPVRPPPGSRQAAYFSADSEDEPPRHDGTGQVVAANVLSDDSWSLVSPQGMASVVRSVGPRSSAVDTPDGDAINLLSLQCSCRPAASRVGCRSVVHGNAHPGRGPRADLRPRPPRPPAPPLRHPHGHGGRLPRPHHRSLLRGPRHPRRGLGPRNIDSGICDDASPERQTSSVPRNGLHTETLRWSGLFGIALEVIDGGCI